MKYGFIGTGNMANAIIKGMATEVSSKDILVYDKSTEAMTKCVDAYGVSSLKSEVEIVENSDVVILAVKPHIITIVADEIRNALSCMKKKPLFVSIAAGKTISELNSFLGEDMAIVRVMPNINAQIGESMTAICGNENTTEDNIKIVTNCFDMVGKTVVIKESEFPIFMAIASCSPAFVFLFIDALAKGSQKLGMSKADSIRIAAQAVMGSASMVLETREHPHQLIDKVCSPGGTTIEGVCTLLEYKMEAGIVAAVDACVKKDKLMSK